MKNAVFFDIDGTLWDEDMIVPESTVTAVKKLREDGNYAFLCSGRSRAAIQSQKLFDIGFDGMVAGCGTYFEYENREIFNKKMKYDELKEIICIFKECRMPFIFEGSRYLYTDVEAFGGDAYIEYLKKELGENLKPLDALNEKSVVNKMCGICNLEKKDKFQKEMGNYCDVIFHTDTIIEMVPKGFSKATGIKKVCELLDTSHSNTYAFGDSANDVDMLNYVQFGIAMGNASKEAKDASDYVTSSISENGIKNGLKHFHLI